MLTDAIVNQIIDRHCNQLISRETGGERALFGGTDVANSNGNETGTEEEAQECSVVNKVGPQVRIKICFGEWANWRTEV